MRRLPDDIEEQSGRKKFDLRLFRHFIPYIAPQAWRLLYCFCLMLVVSGAGVVGPVMIKLGVDVDIAEGSTSGLINRTIQYGILLLASFALTWILTVSLETVGQNMLRSLRLDLFRKLLFMPIRYFTTHPVGKLMARVESDSEAVRVFFTSTSVTLGQNVLMLVLMVGVMYSISPTLTFRVLAVIPILIVTTIIFVVRVMPRFIAVRRKVAEICAVVTESLQGMKVVQSFNQQKRVTEGMDRENADKFRIQYPAELYVIFYYNGVHLTYYLGIVVVLWTGFQLALLEPLTLGLIVMFIMYLERFYGPIRMLSEQVNVVQRAFAAGDRIFDILTAESEVTDPEEPKQWASFDTEIRFENVWFAYKGEDWVLKDVSFSLRKGESLAIVGATGSGKSTILSLLLRFHDPQRGRITVDGVDIRDITQNDLRAKFAFVQQDIFLFPGSVLENLRLMDETIPEERVWAALRTVNAEALVKRLPDGINSEVSERGLNLSQGERQLLSFARALVFDPQVFVLDEATSSVDPHTEVMIQNAMDAVLKGRTGLVIAHRLATVRRCDNILVLEDGQVIESGDHATLLSNGGHYALMHGLQFSSEVTGPPDSLRLPAVNPIPSETPYPESSRSTRRAAISGDYDE